MGRWAPRLAVLDHPMLTTTRLQPLFTNTDARPYDVRRVPVEVSGSICAASTFAVGQGRWGRQGFSASDVVVCALPRGRPSRWVPLQHPVCPQCVCSRPESLRFTSESARFPRPIRERVARYDTSRVFRRQPHVACCGSSGRQWPRTAGEVLIVGVARHRCDEMLRFDSACWHPFFLLHARRPHRPPTVVRAEDGPGPDLFSDRQTVVLDRFRAEGASTR